MSGVAPDDVVTTAVAAGTGAAAGDGDGAAGAPGDVLVLAGKGHETYQTFKDKTIHFDEREVVREILDDGFEQRH